MYELVDSTLAAQGAFNTYRKEAITKSEGWQPVFKTNKKMGPLHIKEIAPFFI